MMHRDTVVIRAPYMAMEDPSVFALHRAWLCD